MTIQKITTSVSAIDMEAKSVQDQALDEGLTIRDDYTLAAPMAAGLAVSINTAGGLVDANRATSSKMPSAGIIKVGATSGQPVVVIKSGKFHKTGWNFSGYIGRAVYVGTSGNLIYGTFSGQNQQMGTVCDGSGVNIQVSAQISL